MCLSCLIRFGALDGEDAVRSVGVAREFKLTSCGELANERLDHVVVLQRPHEALLSTSLEDFVKPHVD